MSTMKYTVIGGYDPQHPQRDKSGEWIYRCAADSPEWAESEARAAMSGCEIIDGEPNCSDDEWMMRMDCTGIIAVIEGEPVVLLDIMGGEWEPAG